MEKWKICVVVGAMWGLISLITLSGGTWRNPLILDLLRNSQQIEETGTTHHPPLRFSGTSNDNSTTHMKSTWLYH